MEFFIAFIIFIALFSALDLAALKWGKTIRSSGWANGKYDVRDEWHSHC